MSGTSTGGLKAAAKNLSKDPDFYKKIGSRGGSAKVPKGFAVNPGLARVAGHRGGRISRPGPRKPKAEPKRSMVEKLSGWFKLT